MYHNTHPPPPLHAEPIYLLYDERMLEHRPLDWKEPAQYPDHRDDATDDYPIENPKRLEVLYDRLCQLDHRLAGGNSNDNGLVLYHPLQARLATRDEILLAHTAAQFDRLNQLEFRTDEELLELSHNVESDMYYCQESFNAARLAAGGLLECVDAIFGPDLPGDDRPTNKALALVRPPGHHACQSQEMGFCFVDSVVVAAKYALSKGMAKKVLILDWDIHDGNATAEATIENEQIFRIDLHRYNPKHPFYPFTGSPRDVGAGHARGLNLNIGWTQGGMGNREYGAAFYEIVLPLIADYQPDLVIISCGLDAAKGDLLGDCCLTPGFFHAMTRCVLEAISPETPVLCALEGGYTISVIPDCMEAVTLAMLNLPFSYHSQQEMVPGFYQYSSCGAADPAPDDNPSQIWSADNALQRSRRVLSQYYVRLESVSLQLAKSAVRDMNNCIRILQGVRRWKHVVLKPMLRCASNSNPRSQLSGHKHGRSQSHKKLYSQGQWPIPYSRPRIYLWYGTEAHHHLKNAAA